MEAQNEDLNLLDTNENTASEDDDDLLVQCDVLEEEYHADTDVLMETNTVDLNDPQSLFTAVYNKVQGTPLNTTLLKILQYLLQSDPQTTQSENILTYLERHTQNEVANDNSVNGKTLLPKDKEQGKTTTDVSIHTEIIEIPDDVQSPAPSISDAPNPPLCPPLSQTDLPVTEVSHIPQASSQQPLPSFPGTTPSQLPLSPPRASTPSGGPQPPALLSGDPPAPGVPPSCPDAQTTHVAINTETLETSDIVQSSASSIPDLPHPPDRPHLPPLLPLSQTDLHVTEVSHITQAPSPSLLPSILGAPPSSPPPPGTLSPPDDPLPPSPLPGAPTTDVAIQTEAIETSDIVQSLASSVPDAPHPRHPLSPPPLSQSNLPVLEVSHIPQAPPPPLLPSIPGAPPPPPQPPPGGPLPALSLQNSEPGPKPIDTPTPLKKMKTLTWKKLPVYAFKNRSIWNEVLDMKDSFDIDYSTVEEMFSQKEVAAPKTALSADNAKVTLLDPKKSMSLNIFLKQFKKPNDVIIKQIKEGDTEGLSVEKLKELMRRLQQHEEIELIQGYDGEFDKLGQAEQFLYQLIKLPDFKLRIEMMLLIADFKSQIGTIRQNIQVSASVCRKFMENESLKVFLRFVLHVGNFINKGKSAGGAIGFCVGSLNELLMTKSNTANITLLHYLVQEAQRKNKNALNFVEEVLEPLPDESGFSFATIIEEFAILQADVDHLRSSLEHTDDDVKAQFSGFDFKEAENDIADTENTIEEVKELWNKLAVYYCENEKTFKVDEFVELFKHFCKEVKTCKHDLETWRVNAE